MLRAGAVCVVRMCLIMVVVGVGLGGGVVAPCSVLGVGLFWMAVL